MADEKKLFVYELIPPYSSFEVGVYDGTLVRIEANAKGESRFETDDPRIASELDTQNHVLLRLKK